MLQYNPTVSGSLSVTGTIQATQGITGSFSGSVAGFPTDVSAFSASLSTRITATESTSSEYVTTSSSLASRVALTEATASQYVTASGSLAGRITANEARTGSFATTGSNYFIGTQVVTGSVYITSDLVVQGSSSLQNITASAVSVGTNTIILNTATPILQFGGISVQDSGSTMGRSGSLLWNSINDHWINVNPSGSDEGYNSAMVINGPKNTGSLGSELGLTEFYIPVSQGEDHITDSIIFQSASVNIGIGTNVPTSKLDVAGTGRFSGSLTVGTVLQVNGVSNVATIQTNSDNNIITLVASNTLIDGKPRIEVGGTGYTSYPSTNFYRAATQIFTSANASVEYMRIVSGSGNVGIGTTNPDFGSFGATEKILGVSNASTRARLQLQNTSTGTTGVAGTFAFFNGSTQLASLDIIADGATNKGRYVFNTNDGTSNSERMRITNEGYIGIVTSGFTLGNTLQLGRVFGFVQDVNSGYIQANMSNAGNYYISQFATRIHLDSALGEINFLNAASGTAGAAVSLVNRMKIASDGRIGIGMGTSAPPEPLSVSFAAHGIISQHRQSSGVGVGQNFYMKFNTANGTAAAYAGIYADIQSNTDGAQTGRMILQAANAGSLVSSLIISNNGTISRPNQPFFSGALQSDQSIPTTTFTTLTFQSNQGFYGINTNSCWNNSTYTFTAPVTGVYLISLSVLTNCLGQVALFVNGTRKHSIPTNYLAGSGATTWGGSAMIPLTSGEGLTLQGYAGSGGTVQANQYHTWATIYLL